MKFFISMLLVGVVGLCEIYSVYGGKKYVSNLSAICLRCLCYASTQCNLTMDCQQGFCGPFFLTKDYWRDAGRPTLQDDDPDRTYAFNDCVKDYNCASITVENHMAKYAYDCNNDGVTDCDDYARMLFHGKDKCGLTISNLHFGRRYETCRPVSSRPNSDSSISLNKV